VEHPEPDAVPTALTAKNESCLNVASLGCLISKNEASLGPLPGPPLAGLVRAHITLAMLALAYLAATRAREHRNDHASEYCNSRSPGSSCSYPTVSRAGVCAGLRAVSGAVREFIDRSSTAQQERGRVPGQHVVQHPCWRRGWPARR
jgi:hypothetical protein